MMLPELNLSPVKFLVADDNGFMRKILRDVMLMMNCRNVVFSSNGDDALEALETYEPDIIITNWQMSPLNGIDLIRNIRARTGTKLEMTPVVILTAHTEATRVAEARDAGANELLRKTDILESSVFATGVFGRPASTVRALKRLYRSVSAAP